MAEAQTAENEIMQGDYRGRLHGVPIAYKDIFLTRGVRTTAHSAILDTFVPREDAVVVRQLKACGAVSLGKANTHEFAAGGMDLYGFARNPWNLGRVPGASSSGSAVAVSARLTPCSIGSDTGGSVRLPAAFCGVVGLRPTYGQVSRRGMIPLSWSMDQAGPLTRTVGDAAILFDAVASRSLDGTRPGAVDSLNSTSFDPNLRGFKIGVPDDSFLGVMDSGAAETFESAKGVLESLGASLVPIALPMAKYASAAAWVITYVEAYAVHSSTLHKRASDYGSVARRRILTGAVFSAEEYVRALRMRRLVAHEFASLFGDLDILITPTTAYPAYPITDLLIHLQDVSRFTRPISMAGLPAISVPAGRTEEGLPLAVQLVSAPWQESTCLWVAKALESAISSDARPPESYGAGEDPPHPASSEDTNDIAAHRSTDGHELSFAVDKLLTVDHGDKAAVMALVDSVRTQLSSSSFLDAIDGVEFPQALPEWNDPGLSLASLGSMTTKEAL